MEVWSLVVFVFQVGDIRACLCMLIGITQDRVERIASVKCLGGQERSRSSEHQRGWSHDGLITGRRAE